MMDKYYFVVVLFICVQVSVASAGEQCTDIDDSFYCSTSCCGDRYNIHCCDSNIEHVIGAIVGIVLGVLGFIAIVTVLVVIFCCCRKSRTGQVCQPAGVTTTVPVYGVQTTIVSGPGQVGYTNGAPNMPGPVDNAPKWQVPPPSYNTVTTG